MRAEADDGDLPVGIGRDGCIDIAVFVEMGVTDSHRLQLCGEQAAEVFLLFGGRAGGGGRVRLGVDHHIAQKALGHGVRKRQRRSDHRNRGKKTGTTRKRN
jgi:hypothetical protein